MAGPGDPELSRLLKAISAGNVGEARRLLAASPRLATASDGHGSTALHVAADSCHAPAIELLLQHGASAVALQQDPEGLTPLARAASAAEAEADVAAVRLLLQAAPSAALVPANDARLPLHCAALVAHPAAVALLLEWAPSAALKPTTDGSVPLHFAAAGRNPAAVRLLLAAAPAAALVRALDGYPIDDALEDAVGGPVSPAEARRGIEAARCLMQHGDAAFLLAALRRRFHNNWLEVSDRFWAARQPLYADLAARLPLTAAQWAQVPSRCAGLLRALPAVLARSEAEACALVARLPADKRQWLQQRLVAAAAALARAATPDDTQLPPALRQRIVEAWLAHECATAGPAGDGSGEGEGSAGEGSGEGEGSAGEEGSGDRPQAASSGEGNGAGCSPCVLM